MAITNITEALEALRDLAEGLPTAIKVDNTLSVEGAAADAKAVGEALAALEEGGGSGGNNMSYGYGTEDLTAGTSPLETGKLYFVYE